jgi:hypothetical protein
MNKLPKEIYVPEDADEPIFFTNAEECAVSGETVTLGVYKLVGKVEVSTQVKQEVIVKKSGAKKEKKAAEKEPEIDPAGPKFPNPLLQEMKVTG